MSQVSRSKKAPLTRPEDEKLGLGASLTYGLQHVLTMYGGIIAVPLIIGQAAGLDSNDIGILIAAALFIGSQLPLVQGVSFASVATMLAIVQDGGLPAVFGAVIASAIFGLLIAPLFSKVVRFFPPVVTGSVITIIGLTLMPVAARWAMGGNGKADDFGSVSNVGLAFITLAIVLLLSKVGSSTISRLSILLAIILGTVVAMLMGKTDFSNVGDGPIFAIPTPFHLGAPTFEIAGIISMCIVVLVILVETTADILAVGEIIGTPVDSRRIADGLRADMAASLVSPVFGSFTQSAFAQNVGLVAVTGIKSRFVVAAGGGILVVLGLLPVLGRVVAGVPLSVLGGAGLVLFGTVAASGIRTLAQVEYRNNMNLIIVATSIGFGMIPIAAPTFYDQFPGWVGTILHSGISSTAIMALLLNLLFNHLKFGNSENPSVFAAGTSRLVTPEVLRHLEEGDKYANGKLVDCDGKEIPCVEPGAVPEKA